MSNDKTGLITMCRKAGKLVMGMDQVKESCKNGSAKGVFAAKDFSQKSLKEIKYVCFTQGVKAYALEMTMDEIGISLGKRIGVMAITDRGFCNSCIKGLKQIEIDSKDFHGDF
ncbi:MAG: L7Ae/L30e/S12e/Gadd45 family ribosomal protein [Oscillospiraceae bacterium]